MLCVEISRTVTSVFIGGVSSSDLVFQEAHDITDAADILVHFRPFFI